MFAFVSAFLKSLHCTDEAQQVETVLSAVLSIYIHIYISNKKNAVLILFDGTQSLIVSDKIFRVHSSSGRYMD